jgi:carbonic anhydrase/acetyltransferase-like protein (isoleucine patch superfamily)
MPVILHVDGTYPTFGDNTFIAPNATIVGDVVMGNDCSIWFNTVIRGDVNSIRMGNKVNVQDGAVVHCTYKKTKTIVGNNVSIGHNAIIHGCTIHDNVLIGMGAIIMDNVELEGTQIPEGTIWAGVPAKRVKTIDQSQIHGEIDRIANNYIRYADWFRDQVTEEK